MICGRAGADDLAHDGDARLKRSKNHQRNVRRAAGLITNQRSNELAPQRTRPHPPSEMSWNTGAASVPAQDRETREQLTASSRRRGMPARARREALALAKPACAMLHCRTRTETPRGPPARPFFRRAARPAPCAQAAAMQPAMAVRAAVEADREDR